MVRRLFVFHLHKVAVEEVGARPHVVRVELRRLFQRLHRVQDRHDPVGGAAPQALHVSMISLHETQQCPSRCSSAPSVVTGAASRKSLANLLLIIVRWLAVCRRLRVGVAALRSSRRRHGIFLLAGLDRFGEAGQPAAAGRRRAVDACLLSRLRAPPEVHRGHLRVAVQGLPKLLHYVACRQSSCAQSSMVKLQLLYCEAGPRKCLRVRTGHLFQAGDAGNQPRHAHPEVPQVLQLIPRHLQDPGALRYSTSTATLCVSSTTASRRHSRGWMAPA